MAMMAKSTCVHLNLDVLCHLFEYLTLTDLLDCSLVCQRWREVVERLLVNVHIDPSTPYSGSWIEYNKFTHKIYSEHWCGDPELNITNDTANLIDKIIHGTSKIKSLHVECMFFNSNVLSRLLLSQDGIQELVVEINHIQSGYDSTFEEELIGGIIKHKNTLRRLDLKITIAPSICKSSDMAKQLLHSQDLSFPMLKSVKLRILDASATVSGLILLLRKLVSDTQLEELMVSLPDMELTEIYQIISHCFKNHNLEKIQIDCINKFGRVCIYFPNYVDILLQNCRNLTHINLQGIDDKRDNRLQIVPGYADYEKPMTSILEHYGDRLQHLQCHFSREISETTIRYCQNLKTLCISNQEGNRMTNEDLLQFAKLEKLEVIALTLINKWEIRVPNSVTEEAVKCFLESCGRDLRALRINYDGNDAAKILSAIGKNCQNLTKLWLKIRDPNRVVDPDAVVIEKCSNLKYLHLDLSFVDPSASGGKRFRTPKIIKALQSKDEKLEWFSLEHVSNLMPKRIMRWFAKNWAQCRIECETAPHMFFEW